MSNNQTVVKKEKKPLSMWAVIQGIGQQVYSSFGGLFITILIMGGMIDSGKPGKLLLLRADMDALPITEDTGLPFASKNEGVMHACGHDVHTSNLLAVARILNETKDQWKGRVKLVFQPGEENGGGGRRMIEQGLMDELPDACFALHVMPTTPGVITLGTGPMTSYSDGFWITIHGKAAHSSTMNIGVIKGGNAPNVIADFVELNGMMRNETAQSREVMFKRIEEIAKGTAALGGSAELRFRIGYTSVYNDPKLTAFTEDFFREHETDLFEGISTDGKGPENWLLTGNQFSLGAEDFGFYSQKAPACFIWVGTGDAASNHSPKFMVEEPYIKLCTRSMSMFAVNFLNS